MVKTANSDEIKLIRPIIANGKTKLASIDTRSTCGFKGDKAATVAVFMLTPPARTFTEGISSKPMWNSLNQRLLPQNAWFDGIRSHLNATKSGLAVTEPAKHSAPGAAAPVETGSIGK